VEKISAQAKPPHQAHGQEQIHGESIRATCGPALSQFGGQHECREETASWNIETDDAQEEVIKWKTFAVG